MPEARPVRVSSQAGCFERLRWRVEAGESEGPALVAALERVGWEPAASPLPRLELYRLEGHRWLWIPTTGRIELRICLTVPLDRRRPTARQLVGRAAAAAGLAVEVEGLELEELGGCGRLEGEGAGPSELTDRAAGPARRSL